MEKKLGCILLVDDNQGDNFLHRQVIQQHGCAEKVVSLHSGLEALDYLRSEHDEHYPKPELIFLDINMPVMNGWEFLEAYEKLDGDQKADRVIVMLTTSLCPNDRAHAADVCKIPGFLNKPLSVETLDSIIKDYLISKPAHNQSS